MPDAKRIFDAMKKKAKDDREEYIFFKKRKDTFGCWLSWLFNIKTNFDYMKEETIEWIKCIVRNMLYVVFGDECYVDEVLENTEIITDIMDDIMCTADNDFTSEDIEIAFRRVIKNKLLK